MREMGVNRKFLYWGVFFVAMGAVMVFVDLNGVDAPLVGRVLGLWPVVVIALGLGIVLRRTRYSLAGGMLAAAMPGLVLGGAFAAGPRLATTCGYGQPVSVAEQSGSFEGPGSVNVTLSCGELTVDTATGQGWQLEAGNTEGISPVVTTSPNGLVVASGSRHNSWLGHGGRDVWRLTLPTASPVDVQAEVDAGLAQLDLAGAQLGNLGLVVNAAEARIDLSTASVNHLSTTLNAGATSLRLPSSSDFDGSISVNAGSVRICAPADLGLRVTSTATLGSATYPGLVQNGSTWQSPDYASASHRAELTVTVNVGSVMLNPIGGCK